MALQQMKGLADALKMLHDHDPNSQKNCIHGDLKPENIVRAEEPLPLGLLQIADMGVVKLRSEATQFQKPATGEFSGTLRYQPPRPRIGPDGKNWPSPSNDMWSMGCIFLEFIIWLLYGNHALEQFNGSFPNNESFFVLTDDGFDL